MTSKTETFSSLMHSFSYRYDLRVVFDDFLTMTLCAFSFNPATGKSHNEEMYMETIAKYATDDLRFNFPKMVSTLVTEMENRGNSGMGNDILGEFYEQNLYRKGAAQYFTPWPVCKMIASCLGGNPSETEEAKRILDPCCGSGRTLLAGADTFGKQHEYYGIDIDHICVKMTAINLFLNGVFHSEVMWADALAPDCFYMSYQISILPFGVFRVENKEHSRLWHMYKNSLDRELSPQKEFDSQLIVGFGSQLSLF